MFKTTFCFFCMAPKNGSTNFYGDKIIDLVKKQSTYYGFDHFVKKVKLNNPIIPTDRFFSDVPQPFSYYFYPLTFDKYIEQINSKSFYEYYSISKLTSFKFFFLNFFCSIYNMTPYVSKSTSFKLKTFSGFTFPSIWFNLHFFLPYCFGTFNENDIKGTFFDQTFPTIRIPRQIFCNFFFRSITSNNLSSATVGFIKNIKSFTFVYLFIFLIPFIIFFAFIYIFISTFLYIFFFICWRDRIFFRNYFSSDNNSFFYFEFWHIVNFFYDKIYQYYLSSFVFFCEFPSYFSNFNSLSENSSSFAKVDTKYVHIVNRIFYYSKIKFFFKNTLYSFFYRILFFTLNFFGIYNFSQLNQILNSNYYSFFSSKHNGFTNNKLLNFYDRLFLFNAYINNNVITKDKNASESTFFNNNIFSHDKINPHKLYSESIFKWPLLTITSIGPEHANFYKNWHFSKFNVEFFNDFSRFPFIDPDFSNFYSKELSSNKIFLSNFSKHDLNRLYGYYTWKIGKNNNFNTSNMWKIFYVSSSNKSSTFSSTVVPNVCYDNILDSTSSNITYAFTRFGLVFIPHFSIFYFFLTFLYKFVDYFWFLYYILDSFFQLNSIFYFFLNIKNRIKLFFGNVFYTLYFFFLKSSYWSFIPFFDHIKNFYINFYTFYTYTNFIRNFYFERSVNKTFFLESLEENDDEETHFTDTIEQSFYNYWWQDFEMDLDVINFFHDEVYDQFTDVFDYEDDEPDYFNTLYSNDDDVDVQHYDFEVHGLSNFRDSDINFSDEVDQDDFEDMYEDLEHFFSPVEESSSFTSDNLLTSVIFIKNIIYDVSDLDRTVPHDQYFNGFGPYSSFELHNASYDLYASFWRIYLYNYWGSNVPINDDFRIHVNSQLDRYTNYLNKWHSTQLSSGKYVKVPNIIRSFGGLNYVNKNFSKKNFEKLTIDLNNLLFPRSIVKHIYFPEQIEVIWNKIGKTYSSNPDYVINLLEKPGSEKIFHLISKSGFEFNVSNSSSKAFYSIENFFIKRFKLLFDKFYSSKYERDFIINFFGQFYDVSSFKGLNYFSLDVTKSILDVINRVNNSSNTNGDFFINPYSFFSKKDKFDYIKISFFSILCCLFILFFMRKYEEYITDADGVVLDNTFDVSYTRLIELFSSIQFSTKRIFYTYLKIVTKRYVSHHNATGEFSVIFKKNDLYTEILNSSTQQTNNLASFDVLGDLGLFWSDLAPNIRNIYKSWNDPFLASLFFPEQFYVILDYANISTFDDEDVDMYEEKIDYLTETSTGDLYDDPYESEASPILEDTSSDPDEENFYRGEAVVTTVLYEDLFDEDDEYFNPDMHWYEQIEDEPEFDEWDIDFFDEIEDINIPIERIFFGEFYRKFMSNHKNNMSNLNVNSFKRTPFYSSSKKKNGAVFGYSNFSDKNVNSLSTNHIFENLADIYADTTNENKKFPFNVNVGNQNNNINSKFDFFYFFKYFISTILTFFLYFTYSVRGFFWSYSIEYASSMRQSLTPLEKTELNKHYKKYNHIYNGNFFFEFKNFVLGWLKAYESFNSRDRLKHITFEIVRSNLRFDNSVQSPLYHSPYSFSWFEDANIPTDFKWEFYDYLKTFFDISSSPSFDENFTVLMDDFIKDFYNSDEIQTIIKEHGQEYFEDAFDFGLFILSAFVLDHEDPYFYSENFFYSTLINLYFSKNKKFPLHSDLYTQDIYKIFEDDWNAIQNEIGFYKEDSSAWLNMLDNPPEDDYIEDPITPFYVSEEHILHSSKEYTNKFMILLDAIWEFFSLIFDYNIYWFKLLFKTYVISYYEALSAFFDKHWFNLSIKYGIWVYFIRSFISFTFFIIFSLYIVFIVPRIIFIYTTFHFQLFFSIFVSGIISFFIIIFLLFTLFFSVYQAYKDINEYERSSFYFAAFISWFTVVWYSIVGYDIYETDDSSSNIFPSVDPDPTLAPDSAILEITTPEIIDFDPNWADTDGASFKPFTASQPVTFGYFVDVFFSQYLNVSHRSLTGHKFRQRFQYSDPIGNYFTSDSIGNYVNILRRKENFMKGGKGIYGHYGSERNFNKNLRVTTRSNVLKTVSKTNKWVTRYSDLRYTTQRLSKLRRLDPTNFFLTPDYDWKGIDPLFGYKEDEKDFDEDKYYKGRNTYSSVVDHSRYFVRNYYDEDQGDHEIVMWNMHYRPYDWFSSNYLSRGFFNSVKKFRPFNFSFDPKNYYNRFTDYLHFFEPVVRFTDYRLPNKLYFAQKFIYGASVYHYKISSFNAAYSDNKSEVFRRFNPELPKYQHYVSTLVSKSTQFNFIKSKAEKSHFKYFYFNRYRYYMSKVNPNSRVFSRVSFNNVGGWPISKGSNVDIYSYDYPLFMENMKYRMVGYEKRLKIMNYHYYLSIKRPDFSFSNIDLFYWIVANIKKNLQVDTSDLPLFERYKFHFKKFCTYVIYFNNKDAIEAKLFKIENEYLKLEQSKRYTFYWNLFWNKTTSNTFNKNAVALPSSALLLNPNYLPKNYNSILAIRRHYLDSINFNSRLFSRKQFKRFWYRSSFVPLIDDNPVRFSEKFSSFKAYESGLPISPTFSKKVSDPISKFIRRGTRRPIINDDYASFLTNKYYKNFFDNVIRYDKINNYFSDVDTSFIRFADTNLFTTPDLRAFNNYSYDIIFGRKNDDNNKNFYNNNVYAASTENANMFKFLYSYNLITRAKLKSNSYKNFFEGKNSRYYLRQIYRYPFSRSLFRTHYDAINDNKFSRINNVPGTSFYTIFNGLNLLPYDGEARLKTPEFSPFIHSYEDKSTSISNYFRARFNRNSIGSYKPGQYGYITDVRLRNIYYTNRFKWAGRHTGGINSNSFRIFKRNYNLTGQKFLSSKFNVFPLYSDIPINTNVNTKDFANLLSKISSQEVKSIRYYNVEYDWPGNRLLKEDNIIKYPYNSSMVLDDSYIGTSSILNGKGLYPFYTVSNEDRFRTDMFQEVFETTPEIFLGPYLVKDLITKVEHDVRYSMFNRKITKFNVTKNTNIGLYDPIDFENIEHPSYFLNSKKNVKRTDNNISTINLTKFSDTPYVLRMETKRFKDLKFGLSLKSNLNAYIYGLDRTPIYSKNYSKKFQRKDAFFSAGITKLDIIKRYSWGDDEFNKYVQNIYLAKLKKNEKISDYEKISKVYENSKNDFTIKKIEKLDFINKIKYSNSFSSPLERYILSSYNNFITFYTHSPFPFSKQGKAIMDIINTRRDIYRTRVIARLQKYVASDAFEKTYSRVFSGSRVPLVNNDPIKIMLDYTFQIKDDLYPTFETWADKRFNDNLTLKDIKIMVQIVKKGLITKEEFIIKYRKVEDVKSKFISTTNVGQEQDYQLNNSFTDIYPKFYSHVNMSDMLAYKLKKARLYNPQFINKKDLEFITKNAKLLSKHGKEFMPEKTKIFSRQTPASLKIHEYVINRNLTRSENFHKQIKKVRTELNKFRPGSIKKDSFVISKNVSGSVVYPMKDGKVVLPQKRNEFLTEFEKSNAKASQTFKKKSKKTAE